MGTTRGTVKWFKDGSGYITVSLTNPNKEFDVYVHFMDVLTPNRELEKGRCVSFELVCGGQGWYARGVRYV